MLHVNEILFKNIQEAIWLVGEKDQIVFRTKKAQEIEVQYRFHLSSILEISRGEGCALHSTKKECLNCPLEGEVSPVGFPFVLLNQDGEPEEFWGRVDHTHEQLLLQIQKQTETDAQASLFAYLNNVRELERKKIAQDLHDGIAQSIYSLMLETRGLKWTAKEDRLDKMKALDQHFSEVLQEVKNLAGELRPMIMDEFGLIQALEQFVERTEEMTGFDIDLSVSIEQKPLSEPVQIAIYRIIQEGVFNAMKYSGENCIYLSLDFKDSSLIVQIQDKGIGFDLSQQGGSFGLVNMKERAHAIDSHLSIRSGHNQGTMIQVQVPLKEC